MIDVRYFRRVEVEDPNLYRRDDWKVLMYIHLREFADKAGILEYNVDRIKVLALPYRPHITLEQIDAAIKELIKDNYLYAYESEGEKLLHIVNWRNTQNPCENEAKSTRKVPHYCTYESYKRCYVTRKAHKNNPYPEESYFSDSLVSNEQTTSDSLVSQLSDKEQEKDNNVNCDEEDKHQLKPKVLTMAAEDGHKGSPKGDPTDNPAKDTSLEEKGVTYEKGDVVLAIAIIGDSPYLGHIQEVNASKKIAQVSFFDPVLNPATGKHCHRKTCTFAEIEHSDKGDWDFKLRRWKSMQKEGELREQLGARRCINGGPLIPEDDK